MTLPPRATCRVTVLTPPGRGAIATVSVTGETAPSLVGRCFRTSRGVPLDQCPCRCILVGHWSAGEAPGEEVVVCRLGAGEVEIHCHGGTSAVQAIVQSLVEAGAAKGDADTWVAEHLPDPIQRSARQAISLARTRRAATVLLDQYRGALRGGLEQALTLLRQHDGAAARQRLQRMDQLAALGLHLTEPWRVVIAGPPNVGKSSLCNRILGYQRAIVHDRPGTTRDVLTSSAAFDGWPAELIDTAGLRPAHDSIESQGVARALAAMSTADLIVLVLDATTAVPSEYERLRAQWPSALVAVNKCDLLPPRSRTAVSGVATSAWTGQGVDELLAAVVRRLAPAPPSPGEAVPFTSSQAAAIRDALAALERQDLGTAVERLSELVQPIAVDSAP